MDHDRRQILAKGAAALGAVGIGGLQQSAQTDAAIGSFSGVAGDLASSRLRAAGQIHMEQPPEIPEDVQVKVKELQERERRIMQRTGLHVPVDHDLEALRSVSPSWRRSVTQSRMRERETVREKIIREMHELMEPFKGWW